MRGLDFRPVNLPLASGLDTRGDTRAQSAPSLIRAKDIQFDEAGGVQTRLPYSNLGSTLADLRRMETNGDELLAFTKDTLYSWDPGLATWRNRGTHLAVKVDETPRFVTPGDQVSCDRAEFSNTIFYAWEDSNTVYVASVDKTTGAITSGPTTVSTAQRPRLVALATKVLLFYIEFVGGVYALNVYAIDPTTFNFTGPTALHAAGSATVHYYDAVKVPNADQAVWACRLNPTTSYKVGTVTAALAATSSTKARTCDGPIAVSCPPTATQVQVVRGNGTNVQGDLLTLSTLADVHTGQAIGTVPLGPINQIAAAHRSTQDSSAYRCYVFWDHAEDTGGTDWSSYYNYVATDNTLGIAARMVRALGVASRAFSHDGRVYVWGVFAGSSGSSTVFGTNQVGGQLQNTYFLYRDDGFLVAKAATSRAGGFSANTGHLPGVQLRPNTTKEYAWAGTERRIVELGEDKRSYSDRGPRDIAITFDSNAARRCARLGRTLYIAGGEILQYDGVRLTEVGFHVYPWLFVIASTGGATLPAGDYFYRSTLRWDNAAGEIDRSTTATTGEITLGAPGDVSLIQIPLYITHKTTNAPAIEWWRSEVNPDGDADFFLVTKKNPATTSNPNRYLANDPTAAQTATVTDALTDANLTVSERYPEAPGELENLAPPPAQLIIANADRLFLGDVAGDPDRIWYSKARGVDRVASFNEALVANVPAAGGRMTALAFLNESLVVFREHAVYVLAGDGFDNTGGGATYGPARAESLDVGAVSQEAIAVGPEGIVFKSSKGWYLLDRGWNVRYIGGKVDDFDEETILAMHVVETQHQIRCLTSSQMLVFDYLAGEWAEWTIQAVHAAIWRGVHLICSDTQVKQQATSFAGGVDYGLDIELGWIKPADLQGSVSIAKLQLLGEYRSSCRVRIRIAYNYKDEYVDDKTWTPSPATVGGPLQVKHGPKRQQCQAMRVRITAVHASTDGIPPTGEALKLTGLAIEVGLLRGLFPRLPAAQRN